MSFCVFRIKHLRHLPSLSTHSPYPLPFAHCLFVSYAHTHTGHAEQTLTHAHRTNTVQRHTHTGTLVKYGRQRLFLWNVRRRARQRATVFASARRSARFRFVHFRRVFAPALCNLEAVKQCVGCSPAGHFSARFLASQKRTILGKPWQHVVRASRAARYFILDAERPLRIYSPLFSFLIPCLFFLFFFNFAATGYETRFFACACRLS